MRRMVGNPQFPSPQSIEDQMWKKTVVVPIQPQQDTGTSNDKTTFLVQNFNQPSYSGYGNRMNSLLSLGKRKSSTESLFLPRAKQYITEERITASMQQLSLNMRDDVGAQYQQPSSSNNRTIDEGFFEDWNNSDDDEEEFDTRGTSIIPHGGFRSIKLADGVLDQQKNNILPKQIIEEINKTNLALVPYQPLLTNVSLSSVDNENIEVVYNRNRTSSYDTNSKTTDAKDCMDEDVEIDDSEMELSKT